MTINELYNIIYDELKMATDNAQVPIKTGNLKNSIRLVQTSTGFQIYLDEGQAPYAEEVNERNPYWTRFATSISVRLAARLGTMGRRE